MPSFLLLATLLLGCSGGPAEDTAGGPGSADADGDGHTGTDDCDDRHRATYVGAPERCDGTDNSCDGVIDEGVAATAVWDGDLYASDLAEVCTIGCGVTVTGDVAVLHSELFDLYVQDNIVLTNQAAIAFAASIPYIGGTITISGNN